MTRYFTKDHEWISVDGDVATVGITDFAQNALGDITFVEVPEAGKTWPRATPPAWWTASRPPATFTPRCGRSDRRQPALEEAPELVNTSPESEGWLWRMSVADAGDLADLMDEAAYAAYIAEL
jgi:glycine cleavage system H protein